MSANELRGVIQGASNLRGVVNDEGFRVAITLAEASVFVVPTYIHDQQVASKDWTIAHNLGKYPSVTVVDSSGRYVIGDVVYLDQNVLHVMFSASFAGRAFLN